MNLFNKKYIQHLVAVFVLIVVAGIYFYPETQGKKILSHDQISAVAAAAERDAYAEKGETILWTSRLFSGMPLFQVAYKAKSNLMYHFYDYKTFFPKSMWLWLTLILGFYICLSILGYGIEISLIGAVAFGLSTWFMLSIEAGHSTKILTISFIPPLIASILITYKGKWLMGGVLTSLFLSLAIMSNHVQIIYYTLFLIIILFVVKLIEAFKNKSLPIFIKRTAVLIGFGLLGVLPNITMLWTTYDYGKETIRGGKSELTKEVKQSTGLDIDYAMQYSYGKAESLNLLIPGFAGSGGTLDENSETFAELKSKGVPKKQALDYLKGIPLFYGEPPVNTGPSYLGAAILFLFLLMFFIYKGNLRWILLATVIFSLVMAWGRHFLIINEFLFDHLPLYNKFRTPSMWLSLAMISTVLGAMIALKTIFESEFDKEKIKKSLFLTGGILGGFVVFVYLFKSSFTDFSGPYDDQLAQNGLNLDILIEDRISMLSADIFRTLVIIGLTFGTVWMVVFKKIKNIQLAYFIFAVIIIGDLWTVDKRYLNEDDFTRAKTFEKSIIASAADQQILTDKEVNFRVFNATVSSFNDNNTSFFHQSVGGYSAVKLIRYQDLIERQISPQIQHLMSLLNSGNPPESSFKQVPVLNMLNMKYLIHNKDATPIRNSNVLSSVWFVNNISWAKNADDEMAQLTDFNPAETAVIDKRFKDYLSGFNPNKNGSIELSSYHPDNMVYTSNSSAPNLAVFSEIWYKGNVDWKAYIDGKETEFIRVNYLLRGLKIPEGKHEIAFKFYPKSHYIGSKISLVSSSLILLMLASLIVMSLMGKKLPGMKEDASLTNDDNA
jgi:hypothetical protein